MPLPGAGRRRLSRGAADDDPPEFVDRTEARCHLRAHGAGSAVTMERPGAGSDVTMERPEPGPMSPSSARSVVRCPPSRLR
jgi:hypothetical protein